MMDISVLISHGNPQCQYRVVSATHFTGFPGRLTGLFQGFAQWGYSLQNYTEQSPTIKRILYEEDITLLFLKVSFKKEGKGERENH